MTECPSYVHRRAGASPVEATVYACRACGFSFAVCDSCDANTPPAFASGSQRIVHARAEHGGADACGWDVRR